MALVFHSKKNPFSGTDVVRDSDEVVCLFAPCLLRLGQEDTACTCSAFRSRDHKAALGQASYVRKTSGLILGDTRGGRGM